MSFRIIYQELNCRKTTRKKTFKVKRLDIFETDSILNFVKSQRKILPKLFKYLV